MTDSQKPTAGAVRAAKEIRICIQKSSYGPITWKNEAYDEELISIMALLIDYETGAAEMLAALKGIDSFFLAAGLDGVADTTDHLYREYPIIALGNRSMSEAVTAAIAKAEGNASV